jgi:hypothetical protein
MSRQRIKIITEIEMDIEYFGVENKNSKIKRIKGQLTRTVLEVIEKSSYGMDYEYKVKTEILD